MRMGIGTVMIVFLMTVGTARAQESAPAKPAPTASVQAQAAATPQYSGFLSNYADLRMATDQEGVRLYLDKSGKYWACTKVMFDPIEVFVSPNPGYKGLQPAALTAITDRFLAAFEKALAPEYQVVTVPEPYVLRVRIAITNFKTVKPMYAELTAEMEVLDEKGVRVAAAVATRKGDEKLKPGEEVTWKELETIVEHWAWGFRKRLDQLRNPNSAPLGSVEPKP